MILQFILCALIYLGAPDYSQEFLDASEKYNIPPLLLIAIVDIENHSWKLGVEGKYGDEKGLMQVYSFGRSFCECGKMKTAADEINCGACWFAEGVRMCKGDLEKGLSVYGSGKCIPPNVGTERAVNRKLRRWRKLQKICADRLNNGINLDQQD